MALPWCLASQLVDSPPAPGASKAPPTAAMMASARRVRQPTTIPHRRPPAEPQPWLPGPPRLLAHRLRVVPLADPLEGGPRWSMRLTPWYTGLLDGLSSPVHGLWGDSDVHRVQNIPVPTIGDPLQEERVISAT